MSDDDSSSDDDIPLSALAKKKELMSESDEAEFDDEEDDDDEEAEGEDEETGGEEYDSSDFIDDDDLEDGDDDGDGDYESDSNDDVPLSELKSPKKKSPPKKSKASAKKKAAPKKKAASAKKKKKASSKAKAAASSSASNYLCASGEMYPRCDKGRLVQSLLARWWYAYEWPDPGVVLRNAPKGYDALDGFPGVFICTRGSDVGKFLDLRDHSKSPSFKNFARKDSEELRDLLLRAIGGQREALLEREGEGTDTERGLKVLEVWATKLNCAKADRQALKVLKAKRLELP